MGFADEAKGKAEAFGDRADDALVPAAAATSSAEEPVEDFAAAGPAPETLPEAVPETVDGDLDAVAEEAEELERHSQPGIL